MSTEQFLNAVLPTQGIRFGLATFGKQGDPDFRPSQKNFPAGETKDLIGFTSWGSNQGANAYFAVAGFALALTPDGRAQRLASAASWHRCLRLDIDVGAAKAAKGEGYATKRDAATALLQFIAHFQLPAPWIVDSGGGLHVYFSFDRDVTLQQWLPMAGQLRAACEQFGLLSDHTTTVDAARVLRMPGTRNNKPEFVASGMVPIVRILQAGASVDPADVLRNLPAADLMFTNTAVPAALRGMQSELQQNLHQPYFIRDVLLQCPGLGAMLQDGGARAAEPLWKSALDLINKSDDDEPTKLKVARALSSGHKDFTEEGFQSKWQQVKAQDYHPPTCNRMRGAGMSECASCPLMGNISSPLVLGRPQAAPHRDDHVLPPPAPAADSPAVTPPLPPPGGLALAAAPTPPQQMGIFVLDNTTTVKVVDGRLTSRILIADGYPMQVKDTEPDENGVKKQYNSPFINYRLRAVERMLDPVGKRSMVALHFERGKDGNVAIEFDNSDFAEPKNFFKKMNGEGLYCTKKAGAEFVDKFMTEFLTSLQRARAASQIAGRCGWTDDFDGFVLGQQLYKRAGGSEHIRASVAPAEMEAYQEAGDYARWRRAFDIAIAGGADRQAVLGLAIAGPLMPFTGLDGVMVNAYSPETGVGKSTLCDAALSLWGSPNVLRKGFSDTTNALFRLASVVGNMPMVVDEFTNIEGKDLSSFVYTLTQGREKHRLTSDARMGSTPSRWCLATIATSNNSIHQKLQDYRPDAVAEAARVFEIRMHPLQVDAQRMGQIKVELSALTSNYGFMGPALVRLFLSRDAAFWRQVVANEIARWDMRASQSTGDRFRSAACALMVVGAKIGKSLGLAFDPVAVEAELMAHWTKQVGEFEADRKKPADYINDYVLRYRADIAVLGGPKGDVILNMSQPRKMMGEVRGLTANGVFKPDSLMLPIDLLRDFVRERRGNFKAVSEWLQSSPAMLRYGRLTFLAGTPFAMTTVCVELKHDEVIGDIKPLLAMINTQQEQTA